MFGVSGVSYLEHNSEDALYLLSVLCISLVDFTRNAVDRVRPLLLSVLLFQNTAAIWFMWQERTMSTRDKDRSTQTSYAHLLYSIRKALPTLAQLFRRPFRHFSS